MSNFLERIEKLSPKRLALLASDLQSRLEELERQRAEPIAIVGMGCRIPGCDPGLEGFWDLLDAGRDAISRVPENRWEGAAGSDWGGFLSGIDCFDASFFNISSREAVGMDPQQRLLLEVSWEALENAGRSPGHLSGSSTGVFVGLSTNDYYSLLLDAGGDAVDAYLASGTAHSIAAGRISYALGLQGPSVAVDTACSASLMAVHLACQSLRAGECSLALAGGVNAILTPEVTVSLSKAHMMAADGRCKTFDSRADGFVRGEGCGVIVLKRLSDAVAEGDRILALIRGSAANQDGRSSGLTAPNGAAQEAVIRQALANARVQPEEISYVETHGTGTALGDPTEAHALAAVVGAGRGTDHPLFIGSVKTNIGHLEAAAGIVGLIKTVLAFQHERIPKHLHFFELNPHIDWGATPVRVASEALPWPRGEQTRLAGISSFGFSGTNVHAILEEAPPVDFPVRENERPLHILAVSARSNAALEALAGRYAEALADGDADLGDFCFTANAGRAQLEERAVYVAATPEQMHDALRANPLARARKKSIFETAFLFPGQGAQYAGMGRELFDSHPEFRRSLQECAELLKPELEEPLLEVLWGGRTNLLDQTSYTQPALFAVEYALAQLWRSWGIQPAVVLGHSVGEYVAACIAGVYDLADGLKLIAKRAALMQGLSGSGAMAAVLAPEPRVREALEGLESRVRIAAVNAPESLVISGYAETLVIAEERLRNMGVRVQRLAVSHGFHSPQMAEMEAAFEDVARGVRFSAPRIELISSVTGKPVGPAELAEPGYWRRQVREAVRFQAAMETLASRGYSAYLESGPGSTLRGLAGQIVTSPDAVWAGSLRKNRGEWLETLESLGRLWAHGAEVDWSAFDQPYRRRRISLPTYPFERRRYWIEGTRRRYAGPPPPAASAARDDWFYKLVWEPKPLRSLPQPTISAAELAESLTDRASALRLEHGFDQYDLLRVELNRACTDFIVDALRSLGFDFSPGTRTTASEARACCRIITRHHMLFDRLLAILVEDCVLAREGDDYIVLRDPVTHHPAATLDLLRAKFPAFHAELEMSGRCAIKLGSVLTGETNPLHLLFPDGSMDTAEAIYTRSPGQLVVNRLAADVVAAELKSRPDGLIRVLEIGAGTGGTTAYVVPLLPSDRTEYVFSDISSVFQARAKEKFKNFQTLRYRTLDIEKDPLAQGFENAQFDIVIAANVLHATADLRTTMRHIRSVIAPGGVIVLIEGTYPEPWVDLTFGLTEGWWRFHDRDLRVSYPLLSRPAWIEFLGRSGFEEAHAIHPREGGHQCVFFARVPRVAASPGRCLILPDETGLARALAARVNAAGGIAVVVEPGNTLDAHLSAEKSWNHIVDLRACVPTDLASRSAAQVGEQALSRAAAPVAAVQSMVRSQTSAKFWIVTRSAQGVLPMQGEMDVAASTVWGIARGIRLEQPALWGGIVDVEAHSSVDDVAHQCLASLLGDDDEDQAAFRDAQRYVPRLERSDRPAPGNVKIRGDRSYLVTGGLRGLGLQVAHWMVKSGARDIVLMGRTGLPDRSTWDALQVGSSDAQTVGVVRAMENLGATVAIAAMDVADEVAVTSLIEHLTVPLGGIIHAASAVDGRSIMDMSREDLARMLRAKTQGTWALHSATSRIALDFFVLFSSSTSLLGSRDLAHYAAANQFLDAFAHHRRGAGLPAVSINWGVWPHLGGASDLDREGALRAGLMPMPWNGALDALGEMTPSAVRNIFIGDFNWSVIKPLYESQRSMPLLEHISNAAAPAADQGTKKPAAVPLFSRLPVAGPEREEAVIRHLVDTVAALVATKSSAIDPDRPLTDFGVDSLIALELRNRLASDLQVTVSTVKILQGATLRELARLAGAGIAAPAVESTEAVSPVNEFPLSVGQQAIWCGHKMVNDGTVFNVTFTAKATPCVAWKEFSLAVAKLVARHPSLRTVFIEDEDGRPLQKILPESEPDLALVDASQWTEAELKDAAMVEVRRAFALDRPPFQIRVFRRLDSDVVLFNVDHIVIDAWSLRICFAELKQLYTAELRGQRADLPPLPAFYHEFVQREAGLLEGREGDRLWAYWSRQLEGDLPLLELRSARPRPAVILPKGQKIPLPFGTSLSAEVQRLAREQKSTPYAVLLAAYNVLLYHYTGQDDIIVGTSTSGRDDPRWADLVGYFVNLLPMRVKISGDESFLDVLQKTRDTVMSALEHENFPLGEMAARLRIRRTLDRHPIYQAFFNFLTDRSGDIGPLFMGVRHCEVEFGDSILTPSIIIPQLEGPSEIALQLAEVAGELMGNIYCNSMLVDRSSAEEMAEAYCRILNEVIRDPNAGIDKLNPIGVASSETEDLVF